MVFHALSLFLIYYSQKYHYVYKNFNKLLNVIFVYI